MAIDRFDVVRFEAALPSGKFSYIGMEGGERVYQVHPTNAPEGFSIRVRSSIGSAGIADEAGEDSIRAVITKDGRPYGGKNVRWVSRVNGWERRLAETLKALRDQLLRLIPCPSCQEMTMPFTVGKEGKNKGRPFICCKTAGCKNPLFQWTDIPVPSAVQDAPKCPLCAADMVRMGSAKGWRCGVRGNAWKGGKWTVCQGVIWDKCRPTPVVDVPTAEDLEDDTTSAVVVPSAPVVVVAPPVVPATVPAVPSAPVVVSKAFPVDPPRPISKVARVDPEGQRFVKVLKDAALMLSGGAVEITRPVVDSLNSPEVQAMVEQLYRAMQDK